MKTSLLRINFLPCAIIAIAYITSYYYNTFSIGTYFIPTGHLFAAAYLGICHLANRSQWYVQSQCL